MAETPENSPIKILVDDLVLDVGSRTVTRNGADLDVGLDHCLVGCNTDARS